MAKDILKEAIADAKAVREVALANAKAALEEAFTPKLQSMLSARLSEELDEENMEEMGHGMEETEDMEETYMDETYMDETEDMEEITGMETETTDLDEEIDLEEILNELELEEGEEAKEEVKDMEEDVYEAKEEEKEEKLDEMGRPIYKAEDANYTGYTADRVHEGETFNLDALLEEINNLDEEETTDEGLGAKIIGTATGIGKSLVGFPKEVYDTYNDQLRKDPELKNDETFMAAMKAAKTFADLASGAAASGARSDLGLEEAEVSEELEETKAALEAIRTELNEVNLLNSKLLYVNRIFKANNLNEGQKLRVVETLDNASNIKEAKLIYETIKDTFTVANAKKASFKSKTKSIHEGLGMASKAAGTSTAPKKQVITEANDMVSRMQKLANIKIN